jgi:hypothetical protein
VDRSHSSLTCLPVSSASTRATSTPQKKP